MMKTIHESMYRLYIYIGPFLVCVCAYKYIYIYTGSVAQIV